ncbi:MAG: hypothetical protein R3F59_03550 [Myxococcota bacterium]
MNEGFDWRRAGVIGAVVAVLVVGGALVLAQQDAPPPHPAAGAPRRGPIAADGPNRGQPVRPPPAKAKGPTRPALPVIEIPADATPEEASASIRDQIVCQAIEHDATTIEGILARRSLEVTPAQSATTLLKLSQPRDDAPAGCSRAMALRPKVEAEVCRTAAAHPDDDELAAAIAEADVDCQARNP